VDPPYQSTAMCKPKKSKSVLNQKGIAYETIIKALLLLSLLDPTAELARMAKQKLSFGTLSGIAMIGGCGTNLYSHAWEILDLCVQMPFA